MILAAPTPVAWVERVLADFDAFLLDHAANERKASAMAMSMVAHYPDREHLCNEMIDLALEELNHFRQVYRVIRSRRLQLQADEKDMYVNNIRKHMRRGKEDYFLDRLLTGALIEARGAERFRLVGERLEDHQMKMFYATLARSEATHHQLFINLANHYFGQDEVCTRLSEWQQTEANVMIELPIQPRLH